MQPADTERWRPLGEAATGLSGGDPVAVLDTNAASADTHFVARIGSRAASSSASLRREYTSQMSLLDVATVSMLPAAAGIGEASSNVARSISTKTCVQAGRDALMCFKVFGPSLYMSFTPTKHPKNQTSNTVDGPEEVVRGGFRGSQRTNHNAHTHSQHHTRLLYNGVSAGNSTAAGAQRRGQAGACAYNSSLHVLAGI
jgi:hypothetical protein